MVFNDKSLFEQIENIVKKEGQSTFWRKKTVLIRVGVATACIGVILFLSYSMLFTKNKLPCNKNYRFLPDQKTTAPTDDIFIDLSGAVNKPGVYKVGEKTRLFMLIEEAGGLSVEADRNFIARNYNLSVPLSDQQKIYFPSVYDVQSELVLENQKIISTELDQMANTSNLSYQSSTSSSVNNSHRISINTDDMSSLMSLPGIGEVTAQRIIAARPYDTIESIVEKGIIKQSLFEKIKTQIIP